MQIIIKHRNAERNITGVAYSQYHIWEHLFIRILQTVLYDYKVRVSGMTMSKCTMLIIEGDFNEDAEYIITQLRKRKIKKRWIDIERNIILNELPCMEKLYKVKYQGKFENYTYKQMLNFRATEYDWCGILLDMGGEDVRRMHISRKEVDKSFHEDAMDTKREQLIKKFIKDDIGFDKRIDKGFYLFCYPIEHYIGKENIGVLKKMLFESDTDFGYYQVKFKKRYPISIVVWPSLEKKEEEIWLVIFTFLDNRHVQLFGDDNRKFIQDWMASNNITCNEIGYLVYNSKF